jgi:3',5'-cyclic AMP phosphodiesterase CpdA
MRLYAVSDLHVSYAENRRIVEAIPPHPDDWLLIAGDVGETVAHLEWTLRTLRTRFARLAWAPGNHELWTLPHDTLQLRGERRYRYLVELCRSLGVLTPEDPYPVVQCGQQQVVLVPMFLLYDYSFCLDGLTSEETLAQAWKTGIVCTDEFFLHPEPYSSAAEWCRARVAETAARLSEVPDQYPLVLFAHFPLRHDLARLPRIPEFALWCGTHATEDWHRRFRAKVVVSGHLHRPGVQWRDGVRFEEVSLGYPHEWRRRGQPHVLHEIVPGADVLEPWPVR